jgi:predicted enzyme related to lactoylglutathione lyase
MTQPSVFRPNSISYLRLPAIDLGRAASFYGAVFGWSIRPHGCTPAFTDASGHVIGHFVSGQAVAANAGVRPYIYVERVDDALEQIVAHGGEVEVAPYPEGDLWVATFRDPEGNEVGVWQHGPRDGRGTSGLSLDQITN